MEVKRKHLDNIQWKTFARKIQKNPFVKNFILNRNCYKCAWCNWSIDDKFVLHHIDYDHVCDYLILKEYPNPTDKRPNRTVKVPDCETCSIVNPNSFTECMSRLVAVHKKCNLKIEEHSN